MSRSTSGASQTADSSHPKGHKGLTAREIEILAEKVLALFEDELRLQRILGPSVRSTHKRSAP